MNTKNKRQLHLHIDADAFFASVEQVLHPELRGKAIVVGQNGGIVSALSYPAKALGIPRVMPIATVRRNYPEVNIVSSDFHAYQIFSKRMENIVRDYFPNLVKNSIDEGSVILDFSRADVHEIEKKVAELQTVLEQKLACGFSFGIASSPLLAKLASGMNKPRGITILKDNELAEKIYHLPVSVLSGIGERTFQKLQKYRIRTIGDFAQADRTWLAQNFSVRMIELHNHVLGKPATIPTQKGTIKSMSRDHSFPETTSRDYLYSQLSLNIEHLSARLRDEGLFTGRIGLRLRAADLSYHEKYVTLSFPSRDPKYLLQKAEKILQTLHQKGTAYRQVSVSCAHLCSAIKQPDLFGATEVSKSEDHILDIIDMLEKRTGKSCVHLASSLSAERKISKRALHRVVDDTYPHPLLPGEEENKRLPYPFLGKVH